MNVGGELQSATVNFYDTVGRLAESQTFNTPSGWDGTSTAPPSTLDPNASTYGSLNLQSEVVYQGPNGSRGYSADGNVVAYQYRDNTGRIDQYQVTYLKKDTYLQADTTGDSNVTNVQTATDESIYDTRGNQIALEQHTEDPYGTLADTVHVFAYNGNGEIIEREDGTATSGATLNLGSNPSQEIQNYTYVNGQQLAHFDNASTLDVLDQVTAFSSNNDSPNSYVVQSGDTLESIAQAEYGNSNLWYVIAQANDLSSDTNLVLGQRLQIPAVTTHANAATTFKPYDPTSIVGTTTPSLPTIVPPPPVQNVGCSTAEILVIIVTVVVTIVTYGATSELLYGEAAALSAGEAATVGAIAGAAGSAAGQLTGMAEGIQSGFNWGAVAEGAIGGAVGGAVSAGLANSSVASLTSGTSSNGLSLFGDAVQGAATYAGNDLAAQITNQPAHFSWAGLVASSVASVASGELGPTASDNQRGLTTNNYVSDLGARAVGDVVNREVSIALGDRHVSSWAQVGEDIAGYAIGQPIGESLKAPVVQAIKTYQDQQAQQAVNEINTKVTNSVTKDLSTLSNSIWTGVSTDASAELANQGQAALDAAWSQTQSSIDATTFNNVTIPVPSLSGVSALTLGNMPITSISDSMVTSLAGVLGSAETTALTSGWSSATYSASGGVLSLSNQSYTTASGQPGLYDSQTGQYTAVMEMGNGGVTSDATEPDPSQAKTLPTISVSASTAEADWENSLSNYAHQSSLPDIPGDFSSDQYHGYYEIVQGFYNNHGDSGDYAAMKSLLQDYVGKQEDANIANDPMRWQAAENIDSLNMLKFQGSLALGGAGGAVAAVVPLVGVGLGVYSVGQGAYDINQGNYVQGGVEIAGGLLGGVASGFKLASAASPGEVLWQSPLGRPVTPGGLIWNEDTGGNINVPDTAPETISQPSFTPYRSELGLDFETQTAQTSNGTTITVQSNQTVAADGSIVDQGPTEFPANQLRATFDSQTGNLNIDWLGANPQQSGLGTEMVSRAIEQLGPENVTSISGDLDASNEGIYDYYYNDLGYSSQDALQMTPAAKIRAALGYSNVGFNSSGQVVGYRVQN